MAAPHLTFADLAVGMRWSFRRTITAEAMEATLQLTGDLGGYHTDAGFARAAGFRELIVPGLLPASMVTKLGGELNFLAREMNLRFLKPVYVGDVLEASLEITGLEPGRRHVTIEGAITNQHGETVLTCRVAGTVPPAAWGVPRKPPPPRL